MEIWFTHDIIRLKVVKNVESHKFNVQIIVDTICTLISISVYIFELEDKHDNNMSESYHFTAYTFDILCRMCRTNT